MIRSFRFMTHAVLTCLLLFSICGTSLMAQSSVVQLPDPAQSSANSALTTRMVSSQLPSDLPAALLQTERALNRPMPSGWGNKMEFGQLIEQIRRAGIRMRLRESAKDNQLDAESVVLMQLPTRSINENLNWLLLQYECGYRITEEGTIDILSIDDLLDNHDVVTYSVGNLVQSYEQGEELMDFLQETMDPDSWESNGGNGRIRVMRTSRGFIMTIVQTYPNHVRIRKQLISMMRIGGGVVSPTYIAGATSRSIQLPESQGGYRKGWTSGGGGSGLGGGVF